MNICLFNDSFPPEIDGVANAVVNYGTCLTELGHRVTVVVPENPEAEDGAYPFSVVRYPSIDATRLTGYRAGLPFSPATMHTLEKGGFDLIHCHCPFTSAMLARTLRDRIRVPMVFTYHTKYDIDIARVVRNQLLRDEAKHIMVDNITACDEVWTVSRGAGENLRSLGFEGSYTVMPNGVDLPRERVSLEKIDSVTAGFDLPAGVPVFLFVGRMMWYKGLRLILNALSMLRVKGQDYRMVFMGGGGDREDVIAYTASLGLSDRVIFVPPQAQRDILRAWYCRADLFLFPSTFDTNGLVVREAAACGLGSVLVRGSCAAEGVTDGEDGFLTEETPEAMAALLEKLCASPARMVQVGQTAQKSLYLSWEDAVHNAADRYEIIHENYRRGSYPPHDRFSDEAFHTAALALETLEWGTMRRRQLQAELKEHIEDLRERFL